MNEKRLWIYQLEDYAYSDFEFLLLGHMEKYSQNEFEKIVLEAYKIAEKSTTYYQLGRVAEIMCNEYGFVRICPKTAHLSDVKKTLGHLHKEQQSISELDKTIKEYLIERKDW